MNLYQELDDYVAAYPAVRVINQIVQFLSEDITWLGNNISKVDSQILLELAKKVYKEPV